MVVKNEGQTHEGTVDPTDIVRPLSAGDTDCSCCRSEQQQLTHQQAPPPPPESHMSHHYQSRRASPDESCSSCPSCTSMPTADSPGMSSSLSSSGEARSDQYAGYGYYVPHLAGGGGGGVPRSAGGSAFRLPAPNSPYPSAHPSSRSPPSTAAAPLPPLHLSRNFETPAGLPSLASAWSPPATTAPWSPSSPSAWTTNGSPSWPPQPPPPHHLSLPPLPTFARSPGYASPQMAPAGAPGMMMTLASTPTIPTLLSPTFPYPSGSLSSESPTAPRF
jgi:hypothetical protein